MVNYRVSFEVMFDVVLSFVDHIGIDVVKFWSRAGLKDFFPYGGNVISLFCFVENIFYLIFTEL